MHNLPTLYLITDRTRTLGRPLVDVVKAALDGGVRMVQLREKDLSGREMFNLARDLRELTNKYDANLLINDRVDIALAVSADGVHLGRQSVSVQDARRAFKSSSLIRHPSSFLIAVSAHSIEEALQAEADGADFVTFGPVYYTPSKAKYGDPVGVDMLREVSTAVNIPVYALGGVKIEKIKEALGVGAYGIAMISAIMAARDAKKATEDILAAMSDR